MITAVRYGVEAWARPVGGAGHVRGGAVRGAIRGELYEELYGGSYAREGMYSTWQNFLVKIAVMGGRRNVLQVIFHRLRVGLGEIAITEISRQGDERIFFSRAKFRRAAVVFHAIHSKLQCKCVFDHLQPRSLLSQ